MESLGVRVGLWAVACGVVILAIGAVLSFDTEMIVVDLRSIDVDVVIPYNQFLDGNIDDIKYYTRDLEIDWVEGEADIGPLSSKSQLNYVDIDDLFRFSIVDRGNGIGLTMYKIGTI